MTSFDVCSKINKSDDRHPQPLDAQSWYLCKKESLGIMFDKWKSKLFQSQHTFCAIIVSASEMELTQC